MPKLLIHRRVLSPSVRRTRLRSTMPPLLLLTMLLASPAPLVHPPVSHQDPPLLPSLLPVVLVALLPSLLPVVLVVPVSLLPSPLLVALLPSSLLVALLP